MVSCVVRVKESDGETNSVQLQNCSNNYCLSTTSWILNILVLANKQLSTMCSKNSIFYILALPETSRRNFYVIKPVYANCILSSKSLNTKWLAKKTQ